MYCITNSTTKQVLTFYLLQLFCESLFILQPKPKHHNHDNDSTRLLMILESGFKMFRIHVTKKINYTIVISVEKYFGKKFGSVHIRKSEEVGHTKISRVNMRGDAYLTLESK